jgi:hypothetical protein
VAGQKNAYRVTDSLVNVGGILYPVSHSFVVGERDSVAWDKQKMLFPVTDKFIIKPVVIIELPPPNGFIFEFYNGIGSSDIVLFESDKTLENATNANNIIWTGQDAWQSMSFEVRINRDNTHWRWDYYPQSNMQYHNIYSQFTNAGHKYWVPGLASLDQIGPGGDPSKVNGLTWDVVNNYPGLLADGMWHPMPVNFPFPHLQWREQDGVPSEANRKRNDVWGWNFEYQCHCRWMDVDCTCVLYPDYVCWIRGTDESNLSWWCKDAPIDDSLFLPSTQGWTWNPTGGSFGGGRWESNRTSGMRRISLDHWNKPWERYPDLL